MPFSHALPHVTLAAFRADTIAWLRGRPAALYPLIERFPPGCVVRANVPLECPPPGRTGIVYSYFEPSEDSPAGLVSVVCEGIDFRGQCAPEWLEVVSYYQSPIGPIDGDAIRRLLVEIVENRR